MLISPLRGVVVSLFRDSYYKSVRLGGFKSVENVISMEMSHNGFFEIRAQTSTFFSLRIFLHYIDIYMVHEREKYTPLRSYISRAVNVGAELNVYWNLR